MLRLLVKPSPLNHEKVGMECFTVQHFSPGPVIGSYYGTIFYIDIEPRSAAAAVFKEGVKSVTIEKFCT